jgi:hypothetical protein
MSSDPTAALAVEMLLLGFTVICVDNSSINVRTKQCTGKKTRTSALSQGSWTSQSLSLRAEAREYDEAKEKKTFDR